MNEKEIKILIKFHEDEISSLRKLLSNASEVINLDGIGKDEIFKLQARKIESEFKVQKEVIDKSHFFFNKIVVLTGEFPSFSNRNVMAKMLHDVGANVNGSISGKTNFVIVGFKAGPKKLELIKEYGIKTFSEHEFIKMF